jgi:hypothetical protein
MTTGDLLALIAAVVSPQGHLSEVYQEGLLGETSSFFTLSQLTHTENINGDSQEATAIIAMTALHTFTRSVFISLSSNCAPTCLLADLIKNFRPL